MSVQKYGLEPKIRTRTDDGKEIWAKADQDGKMPPPPNKQDAQEMTKKRQLDALKQARVQSTASTGSVNKVGRVGRNTILDDDEYEYSEEAYSAGSISFDMNEDISGFCRPKYINNILLERDPMKELAQNVHEKLMLLDDGDKKDRLLRKAELLLNEEVYAKSLVLTYRNSLIFS